MANGGVLTAMITPSASDGNRFVGRTAILAISSTGQVTGNVIDRQYTTDGYPPQAGSPIGPYLPAERL
jgi:hypothetical protein